MLSFGTFVAGNTAATVMADLGAEVVKIEARSRPEVLRMPAYAIGDAVTEPSGAPNTVMQASLTRGLLNVSLDLADDGGRTVFHRLVSVSDVVIENFGSPVLERWGCGYRSLLAHKPDLVMLSLSGYGRDGPRANYLAYGVTVASYLGLGFRLGLRARHAERLRRRRHRCGGRGGRVGAGAAATAHPRTWTSRRSMRCRRCWPSCTRLR